MLAPAATRCCSLLTRSDLHTVSGLPEFQTKLFPFETKPGERRSPIVVLHYDYGIVGCRSGQFDLMSSCFGENAPALHNAHFDVGTAAFPLDLVGSWLQSWSVDHHRTADPQCAITGRLICTLPFVAANSFEASSRANSSARPFEAASTFIPAPSFSPEVR